MRPYSDWKEIQSAFRQSWKVPGGFWLIPFPGGNAVEKSGNGWENQPRKENGRFGSKIREYSAFTKAAKKRIARKLCSVRVADVESGIIKAGEGKTAIQAAQEWAEQNYQTDAHTLIGTVNIGKKTIKASLSHGFSQTKLDAIPAIKPVLEHGQYLGYLNDFSGATMRNHFFAGRVGFPDGEKIVFCRVREAIGSKGHFYVHEVFTEDEIKSKGAILQTAAAHQEDGWPHGGTPLYISILYEILEYVKRVGKALDGTFFPDGWDEIIKSHKYSRKEFRNGAWRYYYDKHNNFSRMTRCKSPALKINSSMDAKKIVSIAESYIKNIWIPDWRAHPEKSVCREMRGRKVVFDSISYLHLKNTGKNSVRPGKRDVQNLINHVKYLPLAKELLEGRGIHTQSRYEKYAKPQKDGAIGIVYQTVSGLAPEGDENKYVHVTVSQKKYADGLHRDTVFISVIGTKDIKKSTVFYRAFLRVQGEPLSALRNLEGGSCSGTAPSPIRKENVTSTDKIVNKNIKKSMITIHLRDITEGNRSAKYEQLEKCLSGGKPAFVPQDGTRLLGDVKITLEDGSAERIEKALRTVAFAMDLPLKAPKGERFVFRAQEQLTDKWCAFFSGVARAVYGFVIARTGLPDVSMVSKAVRIPGRTVYSPESGKPVSRREWEAFIRALDRFLEKRVQDSAQRMALESAAVGKLLSRMIRTAGEAAARKAALESLRAGGRTVEWISASVRRMRDAFGGSLSRSELARIQSAADSAAEHITGITGRMQAVVRQTLVDGIRMRQGKSRVAQELFDRLAGSNRDFQRLADTEIQNISGEAYIREEAASAPEGRRVYFRRVEVVDGHTCRECRALNGKIAVWSGKPLAGEKADDPVADYVIWAGKGGKGWVCPAGTVHPYCRGMWIRYDPDTDGNSAGGGVRKSSNGWEKQPRAGNGQFGSKGKSSGDEERCKLANSTVPITGVEPLELDRNNYLTAIHDEIKKINKNLAENNYSYAGKRITSVDEIHAFSHFVNGAEVSRSLSDLQTHAAYLPFVIPMLDGKCAHSGSRDRVESDGLKTYEFIRRATVRENGAAGNIGIALVLKENAHGDGLSVSIRTVFRLYDKKSLIKSWQAGEPNLLDRLKSPFIFHQDLSNRMTLVSFVDSGGNPSSTVKSIPQNHGKINRKKPPSGSGISKGGVVHFEEDEHPRGSDGRFTRKGDINEIKDVDFTNPTRNAVLKPMTGSFYEQTGVEKKDILIKKNIFEKNLKNHSDLSPDDSRMILDGALYNSDGFFKGKPSKKSNYYIVVKFDNGRNALVVIDTDPGKKYHEVVGWRYAREKDYEKTLKRAESEGARFLITETAQNGSSRSAGLSDVQSGKNSIPVKKGTVNLINTDRETALGLL